LARHIDGAVHPRAAERADRVRTPLKTALDVERLPGIFLLVFGETEGILRRLAEGRFVVAARRAADIAKREPKRAPDGRVGAPALAERVARAIDLQALAAGPVDDRQRRHVA